MTAEFSIQFTRNAGKELRELDRTAQRRIAGAIRGLSTEPRPPGATKLTGYAHAYRIRVGDVRVIYDVADELLVVEIIRIRNRKDAYRQL